MDNKVTKKRINDHLEYDWYKYLIILIAGILIMYFVFSQINRTRDYEDVTFFVSCYQANDDTKFKDAVFGDMQKENYDSPKFGEALLREITFEVQDPLGGTYSEMLQTHGMISSDVLILGEELLKGMGAGFLEITDEMLTNYLLPDGVNINDLEYFIANEGTPYAYRMGIKVSGFENTPYGFDWRKVQTYKDKYENEESKPDENFYLVINKSSVNIGKYAKKKTSNAQALYVINRFIRYFRLAVA